MKGRRNYQDSYYFHLLRGLIRFGHRREVYRSLDAFKSAHNEYFNASETNFVHVRHIKHTHLCINVYRVCGISIHGLVGIPSAVYTRISTGTGKHSSIFFSFPPNTYVSLYFSESDPGDSHLSSPSFPSPLPPEEDLTHTHRIRAYNNTRRRQICIIIFRVCVQGRWPADGKPGQG